MYDIWGDAVGRWIVSNERAVEMEFASGTIQGGSHNSIRPCGQSRGVNELEVGVQGLWGTPG